MTRKTYRTAQGKIVDLGALVLQQENVRAVGNMGVNARGDRLDSQNRPIDTRNQQVQRQYAKQTNVSNDQVYTSRRQAKEPAQADDVTESVDVQEEQAIVEEQTSTETSGLAAAIAKARQIKQEPLKTPRQLKQETPGVNKI